MNIFENDPTWRSLQRAVNKQYPVIASQRQDAVQTCLTPAAAVAWWICKFAAHLLQRSSLHLVVVANGRSEASDAGRWFQLVPWMLGKPAMQIRVTIISEHLDALTTDRNAGEGLRASKFEQLTSTAAAAGVRKFEPARFLLGSPAHLLPTDASMIAVIRADFETSYAGWVDSDGLRAMLSREVPIAVFSPSHAQYGMDRAFLRAVGLDIPNAGLANPLAGTNKVSAFAWGWPLPAAPQPPIAIDAAAIQELDELDAWIARECGPGQRNRILTALGMRFQPTSPAAGKTLARFNYDLAVDMVEGEVFQVDAMGALLDPAPIAMLPKSSLDAYPLDDSDVVQRAQWARHTYRVYQSTSIFDEVRLSFESLWAVLEEETSPAKVKQAPQLSSAARRMLDRLGTVASS